MYKKQNEIIKKLTDKQIVQNLYFTQFLLLFLSLILSFILFDRFEDFLNLFQLKNMTIIYYGIGVALLVIILDSLIFKYAPKYLIDDGGINEKIFSKRSILHIIFLTALIAFSEELLFRGVLQTNLGIWIASIIFAILHFRYLSKWLLFLMVMSISFLLGVFYDMTGSLYTTIIAHFLIDLVFAIQIRWQYVNGVKNDE
ncbi:CPBP family intramembrane glutamic endopeptidase [Metabacillus litoralis]|uniref:CPBP family intramembrane glutamic endopeptidase n=1 Tax=Metabacillus litoralis TaxID=152268 RepID=UPI001CFDC8DC|nr:CPBP family intramembrane glutamic endopeptidase [Metabacillus litoralis]